MSLLNEKQQALCDFMSELSEEAYYAGWMDDLEYVLWYTMFKGPASYGRKFIDEQIIIQLKQLSEEAESWIIFDDDTWETAVALPAWQEIFQSANPNRYLKYYNQ
ncbi:hypothetical protein [Hymenobacter coccineus]|uniref:Uncharacterized protein n=1 Tax=Hymenobacter coccineus TaxID=1908235 RepID=A0A1G1SYF3_9BACT|nr:hypothetical protein [Hymenobacter coccineus]OGX83644.1 hypothetical protein BEN49_12275 [Hymenobacter coccineus]